MAKTGFSNYWFDERFQDLPIMSYFSESKSLDLTKSSIKSVPAGLRGVDEIRLCGAPKAISPDFKGRVVFEWGVGCRSELTDEEIKKAKATYKKYKKFYETPHTWAGNRPHVDYYNLPKNMHFVIVDNQTFLDLRQSNVAALDRSNLWISGVKAVLLPTDTKRKATRVMHRIGRVARQKD